MIYSIYMYLDAINQNKIQIITFTSKHMYGLVICFTFEKICIN